MALTRFGSNVSLGVFGCTTCLTVIHGYFLVKPLRASLKGLPSSPLHRSHMVIVTGVLSSVVAGPPELLELELPPPQPAATTSMASELRASNRIRLIGVWPPDLSSYDGDSGEGFAGEQLLLRRLQRGADGAVQDGVGAQLGGGEAQAERGDLTQAGVDGRQQGGVAADASAQGHPLRVEHGCDGGDRQRDAVGLAADDGRGVGAAAGGRREHRLRRA